MTISESRRTFLKSSAAAATASAAGIPLAAGDAAAQAAGPDIRWDKAAMPVLWYRLFRPGRHQGRPRRRYPGRPGRAGEPGPELYQGLFPVQDHVRQGPPDYAAAAQVERSI